MAKKRYKISSILCIVLVTLLFFMNAVQGYLTIRFARKSTTQSYSMDCTQITNAYSLAIANKISEYMNQMSYYSDSDVVATGNDKQIVNWLREHVSTRRTYFSSVIYAGKDGVAYSDTGETESIKDERFFKEIMNNGKTTYIDNPGRNSKGEVVFHIARAAKVHGRVIGVFAAVVSLDNIRNMVEYILLGESGQTWILADNGMVIANANRDFVMKLNLLTGNVDQSVKSAMMKAVTGAIGSDWVKDWAGIPGKSFVTYTPIAYTPWIFAFSISESQMSATGTAVRNTNIIISLITIFLLIICILIVAGILFKPLAAVEQSINSIASGHADLTQRIRIHSNTEIGSVVNGFNQFTEKLQSIVTKLKNSKDQLSDAGDQMHDCTQETVSANTQILENIGTVSDRILHQSASVEETAGAVNEIASNIQSLERMIEQMVQSVSQASAAVEEMIGNIDSVNTSVVKMADEFTELEKTSSEGIEKQKDVNEKIEQIQQESVMLQEANTAIASIASQTNLLAMNAAIEAAHAGEAGKGFAVVADEIRKLSETSTKQSKTIGAGIKKIRSSIDLVVNSSNESSDALSVVSNKINETDQLVIQIKAAMDEQNSGSKQIIDALHNMNDTTIEVRTASNDIGVQKENVLSEMNTLTDSTIAMKGSMDEISEGAKQINETGAALSTIADQVQGAITKIGSQIDLFTV